ncbi:MAG: hypothetical protein ACK40H_03010 [Sphingomonadaceae bacterium]
MSLTGRQPCRVCGCRAILEKIEATGTQLWQCPSCGLYEIAANVALYDGLSKCTAVQKANLASYLYEQQRNEEQRRISEKDPNRGIFFGKLTIELLGDDRLNTLRSIDDQVGRAIRLIGDTVKKTGESVERIEVWYPAHIGALSCEALLKLLRDLGREGLLTYHDASTKDSPFDVCNIDLTLPGWRRYEEVSRVIASKSHAFIALAFGNETLRQFVRDHVAPVCKSLGYTLEDMRDAARAGVIDDIMRQHIRDAAFVLVDLSDDNRGAYWEGGFAEGLGKPVIYLCHDDAFDQVHFDTNHCTTVKWHLDRAAHFKQELEAVLRKSLGLFS